MYQQYNPECTEDEGVPANCVGSRGCQFCHIENTPAASRGSTEKCSSWVCHKYDVTGCLGVAHRHVKKEYDVGDCKSDVGNRNVGRHVFRDWDCSNDEGVPSACQKPGKTPCRMCMLKSVDDPLEGWPYCPKAVCEFMDIESKECPGLDYVPKKHHHHHSKKSASDEDDSVEDEATETSSKKHSKHKEEVEDEVGEEESTHKHSKKHSKLENDVDEDEE